MFIVCFSALAMLGFYVAITYSLLGLRYVAFWLAFQFAGSEHPPNAERLADAMEPR